MKYIKYGLDVYVLTNEAFNNLMEKFNQGHDRVYVKEIDATLSKNFSYAGEPPLSQEELNKKYLGDREVINNYGKWYFKDDPERYLDPACFNFNEIKTKAEMIKEEQQLLLEQGKIK